MDVSQGGTGTGEATRISGNDILSRMSETQRGKWYETGDVPAEILDATPEPPPAGATAGEQPAASQAAKPGEQPAASTDATPSGASEPPKPNAETRKAELDAEIRQLLETRARLRREVETPPAPAGQPKPAAAASTIEQQLGPKPNQADFADFGEYLDARDTWTRKKWDLEQAETQRVNAQKAQIGAVVDSFNTKTAAARTKYADLDTVLALDSPIQHGSLVDSWILDPENPHSIDLVYHFNKNPDDYKRLEKLSPRQQMIEVIKLEAGFVTPPPKTKTGAPAPPPTLGDRPGAADDAADAAIARGDFAAYERAQNAKELAASGRR